MLKINNLPNGKGKKSGCSECQYNTYVIHRQDVSSILQDSLILNAGYSMIVYEKGHRGVLTHNYRILIFALIGGPRPRQASSVCDSTSNLTISSSFQVSSGLQEPSNPSGNHENHDSIIINIAGRTCLYPDTKP